MAKEAVIQFNILNIVNLFDKRAVLFLFHKGIIWLAYPEF